MSGALRMRRIPKEDLFGIFFVRKPDATVWDSYYHTLDALRPFFMDTDFREVVSGFYLNHIDQSVRISYFVREANSEKVISIFRSFFKKSQITEINFEGPRQAVVAEKYGGEDLEERFRHFLALETQIGLDLIKAGLLDARTLFASYCFQVRRALLPIRDHFEPAFLRHSLAYASLSFEEQERFFGNLERLSWAHMMVNFVLGCDFQIIQDGVSLSIPQINEILRANKMGFQVPVDWKR